jgi:hypothetical protein
MIVPVWSAGKMTPDMVETERKDPMFLDLDKLSKSYGRDRFIIEEQDFEIKERGVRQLNAKLIVTHPLLATVKPMDVIVWQGQKWRVRSKQELEEVFIRVETFEVPLWQGGANGWEFQDANGVTIKPKYNFDTVEVRKMLMNGHKDLSDPPEATPFRPMGTDSDSYRVSYDGKYVNYTFDMELVDPDKLPKQIEKIWANGAKVFDRAWYTTVKEWNTDNLRRAKAGKKMLTTPEQDAAQKEREREANDSLPEPVKEVPRFSEAKPKRRTISYKGDED